MHIKMQKILIKVNFQQKNVYIYNQTVTDKLCAKLTLFEN